MKKIISFSLFLVLSVLTLSAQEKLLMQDVLYASRQDDYSTERCKLDGFSHGSMAEPAFYILRDYIRRDIK